ncbi:peptide ABC transporter substrate-binding protein [Deinococcus yavapaiensis]|uniref:Peptide/nickel transport system substrate-binding protein n=1 Tax=Deinococcus yavapaiensis KR-236 TaxID=694435 RepID=A0A318SAX8_9DEIO|nr:peptide ABC transporter substrate-binding protein [Deinococcus yavapaiensis]PYE55722.1 peptide/nickel transport system substrate-binding protein [Deinococcus yavapaiensis KR-236]
MKNSIRLALTMTATLALAACGGGNNAANRALVVGSSQEPPSLNWFTESSSVTSEIGAYLIRGLVYVDDEGRPQPDLAVEVPSEANGRVQITRENGRPTRLTVRWTLREGLKWSDGTPITTDDVVTSHRIYLDERLPVPTREGVPRSIEKVDDRTFVETYEPPYLYYSLGNTYPILNAKQWRPVYDRAVQAAQDAGEDGAATAFTEAFQNNILVNARGAKDLVTSGPFKLTDWKAGQNLTLTRNDNYWQKPTVARPAQKVTYLFYADNNTLVTNIASNRVDAVSSAGLASNPDTLRSLERAKNNYVVDSVPQANWEHIDINKFSNVASVKALGLDDKRTRQALTYAINRRAIVDQVLQGLGRISNVYINSESPFYLKEADDAYPYDPDKARALLKELGWTPGADGVLTRGGQRFDFELVTTAGNRLRERVEQFVQRDLKAVGINVRINNAPADVVFDPGYFSNAVAGKWKGGFMFTWNSQPLALDASLFAIDDPTTSVKDDYIPTSANGYAGQNIGGWRNQRFQDLWIQARSEFDENRRRDAYQQMQRILLDEVPAIPLYESRAILVHKKDLLNYNFNSFTRTAGWNAWDIGWDD